VRALAMGMRCGVATPIVVEGRAWGAMVAASRQPRWLPADSEARMDQFTELMATAIGNTEARERADRLAEEQAALRRVAMLVATEASPEEVFAKVAEELAGVLGDVDCWLFRDEGDGTATMVALWDPSLSGPSPLGERFPVDGNGVVASVLREGRPSRIDDNAEVTGAIGLRGREELGVRSAVGSPIVVRERVWGAMAAVSHTPHAFPPETETRLARFAELAATAIVNAEARAEIARLADEQAALRRVAMLVAEGGSATAVFDAVAAEMAGLLGADDVLLGRYEPGDEVVVVAHRGKDAGKVVPGTRVRHEPESVTAAVRRTERPARVESYAYGDGPIRALAEELGVRGAVGAPIVVDGRLWGVTVASWTGEEPPPTGTEQRMAQFAELLDTAIANADSRDQLTASRARLLTTADEARRRVVRDLHDGAQQRLLHSMLALQLAQESLREGDGRAEALVAEALQHARQGNTELRELAHGILPSALALGGLRAGIDAVVARLDLTVRLEVPAERFPEEIERSAYFIVAEALTNVVKHGRATHAEVKVFAEDGMLRVTVRDDGVGGADPEGHGLVGLADRATALGGRLTVDSPPGAGTTVAAALPLSA
jgi:signal transduction histidine kinase